ncbi:hypothetical protein DID88_004200 [Monilinia fructigena]|uniref:Phosphotransferase n=1 Tax=Monilinia fructigena TaxID=38457 RepID=A0A395IS21_9HELO|nr:hypothetical protein DID88_004200 [Monilinia fructigena]
MQPLIAAMLRIRSGFLRHLYQILPQTKSILEIIIEFWLSPLSSRIKNENVDFEDIFPAKVKKFLDEVEDALKVSTKKGFLASLSDGLRKEFAESLLANPQNMLPSYNYQLPSGKECEGKEIEIVESKSFKITATERKLVGVEFFDWMADRIMETLSEQSEGHENSKAPLSVGLSWSFPIEQTSLRGGLLMGMGKGFCAADGLVGKDLGDLIENSCLNKGLNVQLNAIVNDSSATLLSKAYIDPTTRFALILGTGLNAAAHLPVHVFSQPKFGIRPASWHECAKYVIVNTELSMFGVPANLKEKYSLETETLSYIEADKTPHLTTAIDTFTTRHPSSYLPTVADLRALRFIASLVTLRSSSLIAAGVHSLWHLRNTSASILPSDSAHTVVAYNGSHLGTAFLFRGVGAGDFQQARPRLATTLIVSFRTILGTLKTNQTMVSV